MSAEINYNSRKKLKDRGIKCTSQRIAILQVLRKSARPLTVKKIYNKLKKEYPKLRLSTIYRNLNIFVEKDLVNKINLKIKERETYFELIDGEHHHHLVCVNCDYIEPLECPLHDYLDKLVNEKKFKVTDHNVKVYGLCEKCKSKNGENL